MSVTPRDKHGDPASLSYSPWRDGVELERAAYGDHRHSAYREWPKRGQTVRADSLKGDLYADSYESARALSRNLQAGRPRHAGGNRSQFDGVELWRIRRSDPEGDSRQGARLDAF